MADTVHVDTEGQLEFCALLMEIVRAGWGVTIWEACPRFCVRLERGEQSFESEAPATLLSLQMAWRKGCPAPVPSIG